MTAYIGPCFHFARGSVLIKGEIKARADMKSFISVIKSAQCMLSVNAHNVFANTSSLCANVKEACKPWACAFTLQKAAFY